MSVIQISWLTYKRRGASLLLVILPVMVLFSLVTLLITLEQTIREWEKPSVDQKIARVGSGVGKWTRAEADKIAQIPHIAEAAPLIAAPYINPANEKPANAWGINLATLKIFSYQMDVPAEAAARWAAEKTGAIVGRDRAAENNWKEGQNITVSLKSGEKLELKVIYVADRGVMLSGLWVHSEYVNAATGNKNAFNPIWIIADEASKRGEALSQIEASFQDRAEILPMEVIKLNSLGLSRFLIQIFRVSGVLAAVLVLLMCFTMLTLSADERRQEIAALRAIGFRKSRIMALTFADAMLLTLPGAVLGAVATYLVLRDQVLRLSAAMTLHVLPMTVVLAIGLAVAIALFIAIVPARRAASIDVLMTLRGE